MAYSSNKSVMRHYTDLKQVPMVLSAAFIIASLFAFGGISEVTLVWLDYTLTATHAMWISLGTYGVAFASSETKQFENYDDMEKLLIASGPAVLVIKEFAIFSLTWSETLSMGAFVVTIVAWVVAVR